MSTLFFVGQIPCVNGHGGSWAHLAVTKTNRHQVDGGHRRHRNFKIISGRIPAYCSVKSRVCHILSRHPLHSWNDQPHFWSHHFTLYQSERNNMEHPLINLANLKISRNLQRFFYWKWHIPSNIGHRMENNMKAPPVQTTQTLHWFWYALRILEIMITSWLGLLQQVSKSPEARDVDWCVPHHGFLLVALKFVFVGTSWNYMGWFPIQSRLCSGLVGHIAHFWMTSILSHILLHRRSY